MTWPGPVDERGSFAAAASRRPAWQGRLRAIHTRRRPAVLTEDQVVAATCDALIARGFTITTRARATEHGHDIVATRGSTTVIIEAKGAGSSKAGTRRYGSEFTSGQVFDHVAKAVLKALRVVSSDAGIGGIALPDNAHHRGEINRVQPALRAAGIVVAWVTEAGVTFDPAGAFDGWES